jgi:hypothetical protein
MEKVKRKLEMAQELINECMECLGEEKKSKPKKDDDDSSSEGRVERLSKMVKGKKGKVDEDS